MLLQTPPLAQDIAAHEGPERQQKDGVSYNIISSSIIIPREIMPLKYKKSSFYITYLTLRSGVSNCA